MFDQSPAEPQSVESRLLLLGIWRRRLFLGIAIVLSVGVAFIAGSRLGTGTYQSDAALLYEQQTFARNWNMEAIPSAALLSRVKSEANINQAAAALKLPPDVVASAATAEVERETGLLHIKADSTSPEEAQTIAATLLDVFLTNFRQSLLEAKRKQVKELQVRRAEANDRVVAASLDVHRFLAANRVTASDMVGPLSAATLQQLQASAQEALEERKALQRQLESVHETIALLASRAGPERAAAEAAQRAAINSTRSQTLLTEIERERSHQANTVDRQQSELELRRAEKALNEGLISQQEYDRAKGAVLRARAIGAEEEKYARWQAIAREMSQTAPVPAPIVAPSETMLQTLAVQAHTLQVHVGMLTSKALRLQQQYREALDLKRRLPALLTQYEALNHKVQLRQQERNGIDTLLVAAEQLLTDDKTAALPGLTVVSRASLPTTPIKSRAKIITLLVAGVLICLAFGLAIASDLRDKRLKAPIQVTSKLSLPLLGVVPRLSRRELKAEQPDDSTVDFVTMARRLREQVPNRGARVLLVSPKHGEGKSMVAQGLARVLAGAREKVLLLDAEAHSREHGRSALSRLIPPENLQLHGIDDYLRGRVERLDDVLYPTTIANISCLPIVDRRHAASMLDSERLETLLEEASHRFDMVLMEGSPLEENANVERLIEHADAILFVVQNHTHKEEALRDALRRLAHDNTPIIGAIVTKVDPAYMAIEQQAI